MVTSSNGFILNPEAYWRPAYRISPFTTSHIKINWEIVQKGKETSLRQYFGPAYSICRSGKEAIAKALAFYDLQKNDEVWIVTTSANKYISSCVTQKIEECCRWSMERSERTKLIFVNHEFGFCFRELQELKKFSLPIIEDRALSFYSQDEHNACGTVGDFVIYSLPKYFPVNAGGVLQQNIDIPYLDSRPGSSELEKNIRILLGHYLMDVEQIRNKRQDNYRYLAEKFGALGFAPFFPLSEKEVPGVFMFQTKAVDLQGLKVFMQENGVESSVFYGKDAFFIPVHQSLSQTDLDFLFTLVNFYCNHGAK